MPDQLAFRGEPFLADVAEVGPLVVPGLVLRQVLLQVVLEFVQPLAKLAGERPGPRVRLNMLYQVILPGELLLTNITRERSVSGVSPHVPALIRDVREFPFTKITSERLLFSVYPDMEDQVPPPGEPLLADVAGVRPPVRVDAPVAAEGRGVGELLVARGAGQRLPLGVLPHVVRQAELGPEAFRAVRAGERELARVDPDVVSQEVFVEEPEAAVVAAELLLPEVHPPVVVQEEPLSELLAADLALVGEVVEMAAGAFEHVVFVFERFLARLAAVGLGVDVFVLGQVGEAFEALPADVAGVRPEAVGLRRGQHPELAVLGVFPAVGLVLSAPVLQPASPTVVRPVVDRYVLVQIR